VFLTVGDGDIDELGILGFLGGCENEGRVCGRVLGFVFANGWILSVFCLEVDLKVEVEMLGWVG
jgi:hypothetical protein